MLDAASKRWFVKHVDNRSVQIRNQKLWSGAAHRFSAENIFGILMLQREFKALTVLVFLRSSAQLLRRRLEHLVR